MDDPKRNLEDTGGDEYLDDGLLEEDAELFEDELKQLDSLEDETPADDV